MILNEGYLHRVARDKKLNLEFAQKEVLNENVQTFRKDSKDKYDIFLSHSYLDKTLVYAVVDLFKRSISNQSSNPWLPATFFKYSSGSPFKIKSAYPSGSL